MMAIPYEPSIERDDDTIRLRTYNTPIRLALQD